MLSVFLFLALGGVEAERGYSVMGVDHPGASAIRLMPMTAEERLERGMAAISPDLDEAAELNEATELDDFSERTRLFSRFLPPMRMMVPKVLYLDTFIWLPVSQRL